MSVFSVLTDVGPCYARARAQVDNHVGARLVSECILGTLASASVVLVTHRYSPTLLHAATQIIMVENSELRAVGSYQELLAQGLMELVEDSPSDSSPSGTPSAVDAQERKSVSPDVDIAPSNKAPPERAATKEKGNLTGSEERATGQVKSAVYAMYRLGAYILGARSIVELSATASYIVFEIAVA